MAHEGSNIVFGAILDDKFEGKVQVTVIVTGYEV
jgi:cell division GTPase FtsZ